MTFSSEFGSMTFPLEVTSAAVRFQRRGCYLLSPHANTPGLSKLVTTLFCQMSYHRSITEMPYLGMLSAQLRLPGLDIDRNKDVGMHIEAVSEVLISSQSSQTGSSCCGQLSSADIVRSTTLRSLGTQFSAGRGVAQGLGRREGSRDGPEGSRR